MVVYDIFVPRNFVKFRNTFAKFWSFTRGFVNISCRKIKSSNVSTILRNCHRVKSLHQILKHKFYVMSLQNRKISIYKNVKKCLIVLLRSLFWRILTSCSQIWKFPAALVIVQYISKNVWTVSFCQQNSDSSMTKSTPWIINEVQSSL
jgi:hypothetical protein